VSKHGNWTGGSRVKQVRKGKKSVAGTKRFLGRGILKLFSALKPSETPGSLSSAICLCSLARQGLKYSAKLMMFWTF
jgi:hypothetical protein